VDEIAVQRRCRGERVRLTPLEREVAIARLLDTGMTRGQVSQRLRIAYRSTPAAWVPRRPTRKHRVPSGGSMRLLCSLAPTSTR
jgi:hypothetical protein